MVEISQGYSGHVMEDIDDVVVILEAFEEAVDILLLLVGEFAGGEGDTFELARCRYLV